MTKGVDLSMKENAVKQSVGGQKMLDSVVKHAREQEVFSREDTPTEQRVEAAFLYHACLPYRRVKRMVGRSYEAVRQRYHRVAHLFEPEPDHHSTIAVDETKLKVEDTEVSVWAAADVDTFGSATLRRLPDDLTSTRCCSLSKC